MYLPRPTLGRIQPAFDPWPIPNGAAAGSMVPALREAIKLSICIPALASRTDSLMRLVWSIQAQPRSNEVEILIATDAGNGIVGDKRNRLVASAAGAYIAHIDDDDLVAPNYVPAILAAIDANPGVDVVVLRGRRTHRGGLPVEYDYRVGGVDGEFDPEGVLWRTPNHLCPMRADLAKAQPFPATQHGEDLAWGAAMKKALTTEARAGLPGEVLYHYRYDPVKAVRPPHHDGRDHRSIFAPQYTEKSGPGSTPEYSVPYREFLTRFIQENNIRSVLDLGCGDFEVMGLVDRSGFRYLGVDVIPERIDRNRAKCPDAQFECADIRRFEIPEADLVVCKDVIQHWGTRSVVNWLDRLAEQSGHFRYALVTNCNYGSTVNQDIPDGGWRALDLTAPPFSVGDVVFRWDTKDVVLIRGSRPHGDR